VIVIGWPYAYHVLSCP